MWPRQASRPYEEALDYDSMTEQIRLARILLVSTESRGRGVRTRQGFWLRVDFRLGRYGAEGRG